MSVRVDLTGQTFGRLTVIERDEDYVRKDGRRASKWICKCECGKEISVLHSNLTRGNSKSCGCLKHEKISQSNLIHGLRHSRIYSIWSNMHSRCHNPNTPRYSDYGGRGVGVCSEWGDFLEFHKWAILNGYSDELSIDRIDNNKGYSPDNCRWVTMSEQLNNRRNTVLITFNGKTQTIQQWSEELSIPYHTLRKRCISGTFGEMVQNHQ